MVGSYVILQYHRTVKIGGVGILAQKWVHAGAICKYILHCTKLCSFQHLMINRGSAT